MKAKLPIVGLLILMGLVSCQRTKKEQTPALKAAEKSIKEPVQEVGAYCFYKLDEKYATEEDSLLITRWLEQKSQQLLKNDSIESLFDNKGGGPNGAEWNPFTDLYLAIKTPAEASAEPPTLYINNKLYERQVYAYGSDIIWHVVPRDFWEVKLKEIDSATVEKMYPPELLNVLRSEGLDPSTTLNDGEILEFDIRYVNKKSVKFFHAAYGE